MELGRKFSGALLRQKRTEAGLRAEQLALHVGRSVYAIHKYEADRSTPSAGVLAACADTLGCSIEDFFTQGARQGVSV